MSGNPGALTQIGIGKETTWGTAVVPTDGLPVTGFTDTPHEERFVDESMDGNMHSTARGSYQTTEWAECGWEGILFPGDASCGAFGHLLMALCGVDTKAGADPYTHTYTTAAAAYPGVPSYTITHFDSMEASAHSFPGMRLNTLSLTWDDKTQAVTYSVSWAGMAFAAVSKPSLTMPSTAPLLNYELTSNLGGSDRVGIRGWTINLNRNARPDFTGNASRAPTDILVSPIDGDFSVTALADDMTDVDRVYGHSSDAIVLTTRSSVPSLTVTATGPSWNEISQNIAKADEQTIDITGRLVYHATDAGIFVPVLENAYATEY